MINSRIKELRLSRNLNQVELAKKLGVSKQCICNWENDNIQPSVDMLICIANFFSVTTDYLLGLDNKHYLEVTNLTDEQISHIQLLINDIQKK